MQNDDIVPGFDDEKEESLKISLRTVDGVVNCLYLALDGYLDIYNSVCFRMRIRKAIVKGFVNLLFDCGGLGQISSTGISSFVMFMKEVKPEGGVVLFNVRPKVMDVLQLLGFSRYFNIRKGIDEATLYFKGDCAREAFPCVFSCPSCERNLRAVRSGRFRCPQCRSVLSVAGNGFASLG